MEIGDGEAPGQAARRPPRHQHARARRDVAEGGEEVALEAGVVAVAAGDDGILGEGEAGEGGAEQDPLEALRHRPIREGHEEEADACRKADIGAP